MNQGTLLVLFLAFLGIRFLIRNQAQKARTNQRKDEQKGTTSTTPHQSAPPSFPEAAPVTYNLEDWRRQGLEGLETSTVSLQTDMEVRSPSHQDSATAISPYIMSSGFNQAKPTRPQTQGQAAGQQKAPVALLPAFNRSSLIQAVVLKEVLERPPSARRNPRSVAGKI